MCVFLCVCVRFRFIVFLFHIVFLFRSVIFGWEHRGAIFSYEDKKDFFFVTSRTGCQLRCRNNSFALLLDSMHLH